MKLFSLVALLAASVASASAALPWAAFQPVYLAGPWSGRPALRVSGLNFTDYDPAVKYAVYLCDLRLTLNSLNAESVTAQIDYLSPGSIKCPFSIWDVAAEKRVYFNGHVSFVASADGGRLAPVPLLMSPSFFFADRMTRTRVIVTTPPTDSVVTRVESISGLEFCTDIEMNPRGFSCLLTTIPQQRFADGDSITYVATTDDGQSLRFVIQAVLTEMAHVTYITVTDSPYEVLHSGSRVKVQLSAPLVSASRLPWAPVLTCRRTGLAVPEATFSDLEWGDEGTSLQATLRCLTCPPGEYSVTLGEVTQTSPPMASSIMTDSAQPLPFREPECTYVGEAFPAQISSGALSVHTADKAATLFIPIRLDDAPHPVRFRVEIGDKGVTHDARLLPSAQRGHAVLAVSLWSLESDRPAEGVNALTIAAETFGGVVSRCSVSNAFEVVEHATDDVVVYDISQRVYFFGPAGQPDTVTITGANLNTVATVRLRLDDAASFGGLVDELPECAIIYILNDLIRCTLPTDAVLPPGPMSFDLFPNDGKTLLATVPHLYSVPLSTVGYTPATVAAHHVGPVSAVSLPVLPAAYPLSLTLVPKAGKAYGVAQFSATSSDSVMFNDAFFTEPGLVSLTITERFGYDSSSVVDHALPGMFTVSSGKPSMKARCFPSHVQTGTIEASGNTPFELRIDIDEFPALEAVATIRSSIGSVEQVRLHGPRALTVLLALKPATGVVALTLYSIDSQVLLEIPAALTIEENSPLRDGSETFVVDSLFTALKTRDTVQFDMVLRSPRGSGPPVVALSQGVTSAISQEFIDDTSARLRVSATGIITDDVTVSLTPRGGAGYPISTSFFVFSLPEMTSFYPTLLDFAAVPGWCLPFAATFKSVSARQAVTIALRDSRGISVTELAIDETSSTVSGCFICDRCESGEFNVGIAPITRATTVISPPATEKFTVRVVAKPRAHSLESFLESRSEGDAEVEKEGARGSSAVVIGLACAAAAVLVAVAAAFALRRRQQMAKPLVSDSADTGLSYTAI